MAPKTDSITLEINVVSARGLTEADPTVKMNIYAVVSITGADQEAIHTNVDKEGGGNPTWNFPVKLAVDGSKRDYFNITHLDFVLKCEDGKGDRDVGEVHVSIAELILMSAAGAGNSMGYVVVSYPVIRPSGQTEGVLNFEYKFGASLSPTIHTPDTDYAARSLGYPPQGYYYPPQPPAAGHGGYGYPPPAQPYGPYPPPLQPHYIPPPAYPLYNVGPPGAPPYGYPPHQSHVHARAPLAGSSDQQRSAHQSKKKNSAWKAGAKMLGVAGALALGVVSGGSAPSFESLSAPAPVPDLSALTSGFQIPDPAAAFAPPDFSNFCPLPDPSALLDATFVDYSSLV
ncbi:protein SRC2-like [Momordica charantia]|uniref:Protein SRC2-like n=1 Tax=Momordica charantia TaxID=3673 RepID=A0A6J1CDH2_MOMCH|nr:protein SRC2-like [Momordica charantia]